jgi:hypothetical protein
MLQPIADCGDAFYLGSSRVPNLPSHAAAHHDSKSLSSLPGAASSWGFLVFLLYTMKCVDCPRCHAAVVEQVPWCDGKRTLTTAYMLFLARWARRLSWKETATAFRTSWEKVFDALEF